MPTQKFEGAILGGIVITKGGSSSAAKVDANTAIQNIYSYVIGVKLTEADTAVKPVFELSNVKADAVNYTPAIVHFIRNKEAVIVKNLNVKITTVRSDTREIVAEIKKTGVDMAPNSVMPLAVTLLKNEEGTPLDLQAGSYISNVTLTYEGEDRNFEQTFEIEGKEVATITEQATPGKAKQTGLFANLPLWAIILFIFFSILILFIFIFLFIILFKRRKKEDEEEQQKRAAARKQFYHNPR